MEDLHNGRINDQRDQKSPVTQLTLGFPDLDPEIFDERARLHGIAFRQIMHTMKHLRQKYQFFPKYDQDGVLQGTYEPFVNRESPDQEARKLLDLLAQEG